MMLDSRVEKLGYDDIADYHMSKTFGLEWRQAEADRMLTFKHIMSLENERMRREHKKASRAGGRK